MNLRFTNHRQIDPDQPDAAWAAYAAASREVRGPSDPQHFPAETKNLSLDALSPLERKQLVVCLEECFGASYSEEEIFSQKEFEDEEVEEFFEMPIEWFDIVDVERGDVVYQLWVYHADCGLLFKGGTTDPLADLIQFGFELPDDMPAWEALAKAQLEAANRYPDSSLGTYDFTVG